MPDSHTPVTRGRVRLARGASPWLLPTVATAALSLGRARRSGRAAALAVPATALAAGMLWFFRDPEREISEGRVISPADGVVQSVMPWKDGRTRVAIFMSPLNVHVNRAPLAGTITSVEHVPGGFVPAFNKESENNERVVWHFDTELGDIEMIQIAGAVARRIVPYVPSGTKVEQGERIGLIRFGSRVDLYLPEGVEVAVEVGQPTLAGVTRIDRD
ncbi:MULTISPECIES: phosphatidylserine decarboxylase [unclassified Streptomyces]|uniref:Phosphatidylserine decarboxylase proenzyme n=1 Tax=Streptomyces evansiae TaxID=3075535 RepID=A0ABU2QZ89_9ACTN|nr:MULTISPECIES: phosphatidylserine decarboxylase [unclassified Streptomyces]ASY31997.1 phosphatidylserine decarboxylase [Streptomyces sp. CLI2509]EFL03531.1 phosphatidylserine decarboxylase [Streptomyces sp. SPB78]MDT0409772.1 phosphatidylserine decarboxylase [Streptomyces sp. DSM 41979]MDT0422886.1 phosphatidylserine decarboxylase [Streptomyces sp. DSM 41859]MYQ60436.1 phosphatidylserine decarboxylase [Streptomyces sp. SID4926]